MERLERLNLSLVHQQSDWSYLVYGIQLVSGSLAYVFLFLSCDVIGVAISLASVLEEDSICVFVEHLFKLLTDRLSPLEPTRALLLSLLSVLRHRGALLNLAVLVLHKVDVEINLFKRDCLVLGCRLKQRCIVKAAWAKTSELFIRKPTLLLRGPRSRQLIKLFVVE